MMNLLAQAPTQVQTYGNNAPQLSDAAAAGIGLALIAVALVIVIAVSALICWLIYKPYSKLPAQFQQMKPGMIFLMMIPFFGLVWAFFIALQVPASFKSYFDSVGDTTVGDAGKGIALAWAICAACSIVPFLNLIAGPASLVLLIIFIVKLFNMAGRVDQVETAATM